MGGYNMMFSICLSVGHIAAICSDKNLVEGLYGSQNPGVLAVGFSLGILGLVYGYATLQIYNKIQYIQWAILMRDLNFSFNIAFGIADTVCLIMENDHLINTINPTDKKGYHRVVQIVWVVCYFLFIVVNMVLIKTLLLNNTPIMPYGNKMRGENETENEFIEAIIEVAREEKILQEKLTTRSTED